MRRWWRWRRSAIQAAGPSIVFLLHDLNEKVQLTAIEATGLLLNRDAINELRDILDRSRNMKVKRAALTALAQMPDLRLHGVFVTYLDHKDEGLREGAAEGLGRLKNPADTAALERAFNNENKTEPRLSAAFALVDLGKRGMAEFDPLRYLVNDLNSTAYRGVSLAYLTELARDPGCVKRCIRPSRSRALPRTRRPAWPRCSPPAAAPTRWRPSKRSRTIPIPKSHKRGLRAVQNLHAHLP